MIPTKRFDSIPRDGMDAPKVEMRSYFVIDKYKAPRAKTWPEAVSLVPKVNQQSEAVCLVPKVKQQSEAVRSADLSSTKSRSTVVYCVRTEFGRHCRYIANKGTGDDGTCC